jgi:hypothetical protein
MAITWVPSKKAIAAGFPVGINPAVDYNMETSSIPTVSMEVMATRAYRHMLNNEAASAALNAKEAAEEKNEAFDSVQWLHAWRMDKRNEILEGKLGLRQPSEAVIVDPVEREANDRAFDVIAQYVAKQGHTFPYTVRNARSLAWTDSEGTTMADLITRLLTTTKRGAAIVEKAKATVAEREADKEAVDEDLFAAE